MTLEEMTADTRAAEEITPCTRKASWPSRRGLLRRLCFVSHTVRVFAAFLLELIELVKPVKMPCQGATHEHHTRPGDKRREEASPGDTSTLDSMPRLCCESTLESLLQSLHVCTWNLFWGTPPPTSASSSSSFSLPYPSHLPTGQADSALVWGATHHKHCLLYTSPSPRD